MAILVLICGMVLGSTIEDDATMSEIKRKGWSGTRKGFRIVGHVEQKIAGFKDKWERIGTEE